MSKQLLPPSVFAVGRLEEALECALTYLLFHEGEEFVTENVEYYREELGRDGRPREVRSFVCKRFRCHRAMMCNSSK